MIKFKHVFLICLISAVFCTGFYIGYNFYSPREIIKEVEVIKNVDHIIYRDYSNVDCCEIAKNYDTSFMEINYTINALKPAYTDLDLTWRLYDRSGMQNIHVPVHREGNWKFYAGIGIGAGAIGGLAYLLLK